MQLKRSLSFLDLETTELERESCRIIEIAVVRFNPSGLRGEFACRLNPGIPIPPAVTELTGISDADVADRPAFRDIADELFGFLDGSDIAGFNSNVFDIPVLYNEFARAGIHWDHTKFRMIDVGNIYKIKEPRTLSAAVMFYTGTEHEGAHGALDDVHATAQVFEVMLECYPDIPTDMDELQKYSNYGRPILDLSGKFTSAEDGTILLNFGKHRGEPAAQHLDFVNWMYYKDFPVDTTLICERLLKEGGWIQ